MDKTELIQKITEKKEFSQLPEKDVELAFSHFEKKQVSDEEKINLTRELLHKVFGAFTSQKLLSPKNKSEEWILRKHLSTRERLPYYSEIYKKMLEEYKNKVKTGSSFIHSFSGKSQMKKISIIDLGAGVNGFSYKYFKDSGVKPILNDDASFAPPTSAPLPLLRPSREKSPPLEYARSKVNYLAIESVGQLVNLMNNYFEKNKLNACAIHESLFELEKIKKIITETKKPRIIFLFKVLDSLEIVENDYSKKLLKEITPLADKVVVSFATESMIKRKKFKVKRNWILNFINENFQVLEDFEIGGERYIFFRAK